jgi:DNA primase catalytic core
MVTHNHAFVEAKEQIRDFLPQYLESQNINTRKQFRCIDPNHNDTHPSAGIIKQLPKLGHCFSCGVVFDIFDAAAFLECKPSAGRGWFTDNFMYLANRFGVPVPEVNLSDAELFEMEVYGAYAHASQIIRHSSLSDKVKAKLVDYGWNKEVTWKLGIGGVTNYEDYITKMTGQYGHSLSFLEKIDLAGPAGRNIFNPNNLIYTIKNDRGDAVAFSARDLNYEEKIIAHDLMDPKPEYKPRKYFHTSNDCPIFDKSRILFNFDLAKKTASPFVIFEGQPDVVTCFAGGIQGAVGLLGTAFTKEHLEMILATGKKHIVFVLDPDKAGKTATDRAMKLINECSGHVGLKVEVIEMPGTQDPDAYVRSFGSLAKGVQSLRQLSKKDMFSYKLEKAIEAGEDPVSLCQSTLPVIVNEVNNLIRQQMADKLAAATGQDKEYVRREVLRMIDNDRSALDEELNLIANNAASLMRKAKPGEIQAIIAQTQEQIERVEKRKLGYDVNRVLKSSTRVFEHQIENKNSMDVVTGNPIFDTMFGGLPRHGVLFCLPGKPHHGKSIFLDNLINGILDNNQDVIVLLHTVDDSLDQRIPRLLGARTGLDSKYFMKAGYYLQDPEGREKAPAGFEALYHNTMQWYLTMTEQERLIAVDTEDLPGDVMALRSWARELRQQHPDRTMILIGDNFHLYDMQTQETGEGKTRGISRAINEMLNTLHITGLFTMEIPKEQLKPGIRPTYLNLKGSGGLSFDAKVNISVYNELQDLGNESCLHWANSRRMEKILGPNGEELIQPRKCPVIEIICDKNKVTGEKATLFYHLDDRSGHMEECPVVLQEQYRRTLEEHQRSRRAESQLNGSRAEFRKKM